VGSADSQRVAPQEIARTTVPPNERMGLADFRVALPEGESLPRPGTPVTVLARARNVKGPGPWADCRIVLGQWLT
jgi:hypothetical protein